MIVTTIPALRLQVAPEFSLLRVAVQPEAASCGYQAACEELLRVAQQHLSRCYLIDLGAGPDIPLRDQLWLSQSWMPRALRLPLERVVCCIPSARVHNQLAIESLIYLAGPLPCDLQFFTQPSAALAWLLDEDPAHADLLAEWHTHFGPSPADRDEVAEPLMPYRRPGRPA